MSTQNDDLVSQGMASVPVTPALTGPPAISIEYGAGVVTILQPGWNGALVSLTRDGTLLTSALGATYADAGLVKSGNSTTVYVASGVDENDNVLTATAVLVSMSVDAGKCICTLKLATWSSNTVVNLSYPSAPQQVGDVVVVNIPQCKSPDQTTGVVTFDAVIQGATIYIDALRKSFTVPSEPTFELTLS